MMMKSVGTTVRCLKKMLSSFQTFFSSCLLVHLYRLTQTSCRVGWSEDSLCTMDQSSPVYNVGCPSTVTVYTTGMNRRQQRMDWG